jgi:predicted nucleic acid-binding protein
MSKYFVDTSAYFALLNARDASHVAAVTIFRRLAHERAELYTSNFVLAETHRLLVNRTSRQLAFAFLHELEAGSTHLVWGSVGDEQRARAILGTYVDKDFSYVDAVSFAMMERLHITQAFSFDDHFAQYGFLLLHP